MVFMHLIPLFLFFVFVLQFLRKYYTISQDSANRFVAGEKKIISSDIHLLLHCSYVDLFFNQKKPCNK